MTLAITFGVAAMLISGIFLLTRHLPSPPSPPSPQASPSISLPILNLLTDTEIPWDNKIPCVVNLSDDNNTEALSGTVKCHGGYSSRYPKHSYALEFSDKYSLGGLPSDDDFILNANYIDKTFQRHKISYDLFREMNPQKNIAPQCSYANVQLNGKDQGLYVLMQKVTAKTAGVDKSDNNALLFKEPPIFYAEKIFSPQEPDNYYQQKYPKIKKEDRSQEMEELNRFLFQSSDAEFTEKVSQLFDIENIIDWHLLLLFTNNSDGLLKNFYLYRTNSDTPYRIIPWDYDHSFGRDGDGEKNLLKNVIDCDRCILLKRLCHIEGTGYNEKLADRYRELRQNGIFSEKHFKEMVDENNLLISTYIDKDAALWPWNVDKNFDQETYQDEINLMIQYVKTRLEQLDHIFP
ncbi:MAG: CotH kinase family protein [Bacteroidales bacterium]|nr:CotH kinase family protein [Bacteroidales bacterium]